MSQQNQNIKNEIALSENQETTAPVKKKRGRGNPALSPDAISGPVAATILRMVMEVGNLPDIDVNDVEQVRQRVNEYFTIVAKWEQKPTVSGLAGALGMDRRKLWAIVNDQPYGSNGKPISIARDSSDLIKKTYRWMEQLLEGYVEAGQVNPVIGIFLAKNHFGYQDKQEYVVTPNTGNEFNPADIRSRYIESSDS